MNREIKNERNIFYFEAGSVSDLAEKMKEFLNMDIKRPAKDELLLQGTQRKRLLGEHLLAAVRYVMML